MEHAKSTPAVIEVTAESLPGADICCAKANTPDGRRCTAAKKAWMAGAFEDGYRFTRLDAPGKVFIETVPAENAWCPIMADGWLFIDCLWVSGQAKGAGCGRRLIALATERARAEGRSGLVAVTADKKRPFLSDPRFLAHMGFTVTDEAPPFYRLAALPLDKTAEPPRFAPGALAPKGAEADGLAVWYSAHCPYTEKYLDLLARAARGRGVPFHSHRVKTKLEAQAAPNPFPTWAMFWRGSFVTNELFSAPKLMKFLDEHGDD